MSAANRSLLRYGVDVISLRTNEAADTTGATISDGTEPVALTDEVRRDAQLLTGAKFHRVKIVLAKARSELIALAQSVDVRVIVPRIDRDFTAQLYNILDQISSEQPNVNKEAVQLIYDNVYTARVYYTKALRAETVLSLNKLP